MKKNLVKKVLLLSFVFTSFMFSSCSGFMGGDELLAEFNLAKKNANSNEAIIKIECSADKKSFISPQVGPLVGGGRKEGTVLDLEFEESKDYIFDKWIATPEGSVNFENETERKTKATIISSKEDITIEPVCIKKYVLTVNFSGEHGTTNPYEQKKYFPKQSFMLSYRSESDYGFTKWEILDSKTKKVMENPPVKIIGTGTEVNVEVLAMESDMEITVKAAAVRRPSIISYSPDWSENGEDSTQTITAMFSQKMNPADISKYITIVNRATKENLNDYFSEPYFDTALTTLRMNAKKEKLLPKDAEIVVTLSSEMCDENKIKLGSDFTWTYKVNGKRDETPGYFNELKMYAAVNGAGKYVANREILFDKKEDDFKESSNLKTYNLVEKKIILSGSVVDEGSGPDFVNWKLSKINNTFYPTDYGKEVDVVSKQEIASEFLNFAGQVAYFQNNGANPTIDLSNDIKESGVYKLSLTVTDKSGNVSEPNDFFFDYDVSAPEITGLFENRSLGTQTNILGTLDKCKDFDKVVISICGYETGGTDIDKLNDIVIDKNTAGINETIKNIKPNYSYEFNFVSYDKAGNSKTFKIERDTTPLPHIDVNDITVKTFAKDVVKVTFPIKSGDDFMDYWKTEITVKDEQDFKYVCSNKKSTITNVNGIASDNLLKADFFVYKDNITDPENDKLKEIYAFRNQEKNDPDYFNNFSTEKIEFARTSKDFEIIKDLNFKRLNATLLITEYDFAGNKTETEVQVKSQMDIGMYYHMDGYWSYDNHGKDTLKYLDYPVGVIIDLDSENVDSIGTIISYNKNKTKTPYLPEKAGIAEFGNYNSSLDEDSEVINFLINNKIAVTDEANLTNPSFVSTDGYANTYMILDNEVDMYFIPTKLQENFWEAIQEENIKMMNSVPDFKWYLPSVYEALNIIEKVNEISGKIGLVLDSRNTQSNPIVCSNFFYDESSKKLKRYRVSYESKKSKVVEYLDTGTLQTRTPCFAKVNPDW